jgi:hypothetical protein
VSDVQSPKAESAAERQERDERGRYLPGSQEGNQHARTSGVRAFELHGEAALPSELRDELAAFRAALMADQGGASELTAIRAGYVQRLSEVEACLRLLAEDLRTRGLMTKRGRVRSTYDKLLQTIDRWDRLAQRLGMERRTLQVSSFAAAVAEANRGSEQSK